jgi:rfaE bifunctional protein nucleotidyltransferase chain/domain
VIAPQDKLVLDEKALLSRLAALPRPLVFTNGVFDILHRGHAAYLHSASELGGSLLVALNSDSSVRMLGKGDDRPINPELDRAYLVAALASTTLVTLFTEKTPLRLISVVKPDLYVKGGDYDIDKLEETALVRTWGGRSLALPFVDGYSTTSLARKMKVDPTRHVDTRPAAFLDRDGVINFDVEYLHEWSAFRFLPGVVDALRDLQALGYRLIVITNQSGIARGMYTEEDYQALTARLNASLLSQGVRLDAVYHCPHHPDGCVAEYRHECDCRKPGTGMIAQALHDLDIDLTRSIIVGDKPSDIEAGIGAGVGRRFIVSCNGEGDLPPLGNADCRFKDLAECVAYLKNAAR